MKPLAAHLSGFVREWLRANPTPTQAAFNRLLARAMDGDAEAIEKLPAARDAVLAEAKDALLHPEKHFKEIK